MTAPEITTLCDLRRQLKLANAASLKAATARANLPAGSSRARVTSANAKWARKAEERDRLLAAVAELEAGS